MSEPHIFYLTREEFLKLAKLDETQKIKGKDVHHYLKRNDEGDAFIIRFIKPYNGILEYIPYANPIESFIFEFADRDESGNCYKEQ